MVFGKQFNRGVQGLTKAYETLGALLINLKAFFNLCKDENNNIEQNVGKPYLTVTIHLLTHSKARKILNSSFLF